MTTAEQFRSAVAHPTSEISIAGVPWPAYKVLALVVGVLVFGIVAAVAGSAAPAVLSGAAVATVLWLALGLLHREH
jgi:hypothetical protein